MNKRRTKRVRLTCSCGKVAHATLLESEQGIYRINEFLCADDLRLMAMEIIDETASVDKKDDKAIQGTDGPEESGEL